MNPTLHTLSYLSHITHTHTFVGTLHGRTYTHFLGAQYIYCLSVATTATVPHGFLASTVKLSPRGLYHH